MPARPGQLKLCAGAPATPSGNLASNPDYVEFTVDVIDSTGAPTTGLAQSDFVATGNGRPIPIAYFRTEQGRPPVSIGILVDKSGSMVTKLPVVSSSVDALLSKLEPCDEVFLFAFGMDPILVEDFTTDHTLISQRMRLVGASGQTPFYDGVRQGVARLDAGHYPDRVIVIFTDDLSSLDNASRHATRDDVVSSALNSQNRSFVVGVGKPDATAHPISIGIYSLTFGSAHNGVDAEDLGKFATDLGGEFFLITAEPDENAPKVSTRERNVSVYSPSPRRYAPLVADPGQVQQFAASVASQIDRHYTIGLITSGPPASTAGQISIKLANHPSARTTVHPIKLPPSTPSH
ncbi:MAG: VWA domain-containing protein [Candidatus Binatus sp.]